MWECFYCYIYICDHTYSQTPISATLKKEVKGNGFILYFIFTLYGLTVIYIYIILIIEMMFFPGGYGQSVEIKQSRQEFTLLLFELCFVFLLHLLMETWMASAFRGCLSSKIPPWMGHTLCSVLYRSSQDVGQPGLANSLDGTASALRDGPSLHIQSLLFLTPNDVPPFPLSAALPFVLPLSM